MLVLTCCDRPAPIRFVSARKNPYTDAIIGGGRRAVNGEAFGTQGHIILRPGRAPDAPGRRPRANQGDSAVLSTHAVQSRTRRQSLESEIEQNEMIVLRRGRPGDIAVRASERAAPVKLARRAGMERESRSPGACIIGATIHHHNQ